MPELLQETISTRTFIKATPEKVYQTITSAEGWDAFFTTGFQIDLQPGGKLYFRWKDWGPNFYTTEVEGEVIECRCPDFFKFKWGTKMPSTVEFSLTAEFGGTVVRLLEYGYPDSSEGLKNMLECASGWGEALALLKFYLEHGVIYTQPRKGN